VVDSSLTTRNRLDGILQLGSRTVALVSHSAQLHRGRTLHGNLALLANAGRRSAPKAF
jgi:hypothetical protein